MAMRAVPINAAVPTAVEARAPAAAPDNAVMGPPKVPTVQGAAGSRASAERSPRGGPRGLDSRETAGVDSAQTDNSKKRKADGEARPSLQVATAVAGAVGKRRASPEAEVVYLFCLYTQCSTAVLKHSVIWSLHGPQ